MHVQSTQNKFPYLCNISIKECGIKLIFCLQINIKVFYKMIVSPCMPKAPKTTGLQYVKENEKDEVDFLPDNKRWTFAIILIKMVKYSQSSENSMFAMSLLYLKKEVRDKVYLLHADKFSYKLISTLWASKFSTRWYYHYWWAWSSILKVLKVTSL